MSFKETAPFGLKNERLRAWVEQAMATTQVSAVGAARLSAASLYQASRLIRHVRARLRGLWWVARVTAYGRGNRRARHEYCVDTAEMSSTTDKG